MSDVPSGKGMARVVTIVGLMLVWGLVWANLPSKEEWRSMPVKPGIDEMDEVPGQWIGTRPG